MCFLTLQLHDCAYKIEILYEISCFIMCSGCGLHDYLGCFIPYLIDTNCNVLGKLTLLVHTGPKQCRWEVCLVLETYTVYLNCYYISYMWDITQSIRTLSFGCGIVCSSVAGKKSTYLTYFSLWFSIMQRCSHLIADLCCWVIQKYSFCIHYHDLRNFLWESLIQKWAKPQSSATCSLLE